jgi:hypothetical protein
MMRSESMLLVLALTGLSACTSWQVQSASPQQVLAERRPEQVRVTHTDSTTMVLNQPRSWTTRSTAWASPTAQDRNTLTGMPWR